MPAQLGVPAAPGSLALPSACAAGAGKCSYRYRVALGPRIGPREAGTGRTSTYAAYARAQVEHYNLTTQAPHAKMLTPSVLLICPSTSDKSADCIFVPIYPAPFQIPSPFVVCIKNSIHLGIAIAILFVHPECVVDLERRKPGRRVIQHSLQFVKLEACGRTNGSENSVISVIHEQTHPNQVRVRIRVELNRFIHASASLPMTPRANVHINDARNDTSFASCNSSGVALALKFDGGNSLMRRRFASSRSMSFL